MGRGDKSRSRRSKKPQPYDPSREHNKTPKRPPLSKVAAQVMRMESGEFDVRDEMYRWRPGEEEDFLICGCIHCRVWGW